MVNPSPPRLTQLVAEALGTGEIPDEVSTILTARVWTVHKDGAALSLEKRSGRGIHYFRAHLALGVDLIPGLDQMTLFGGDPDRMVYILKSVFSVWVDLYSSSQHIFSCYRTPPGGGDSPRGLHGAALRLRHAMSGPCESLGGNLPARLA